jgi:hypothetical protein
MFVCSGFSFPCPSFCPTRWYVLISELTCVLSISFPNSSTYRLESMVCMMEGAVLTVTEKSFMFWGLFAK